MHKKSIISVLKKQPSHQEPISTSDSSVAGTNSPGMSPSTNKTAYYSSIRPSSRVQLLTYAPLDRGKSGPIYPIKPEIKYT